LKPGFVSRSYVAIKSSRSDPIKSPSKEETVQKTTLTTLGKRVTNDEFLVTLAEKVRKKAAQSRAAQEDFNERNAPALDRLAEEIQGLDESDPRIVALWTMGETYSRDSRYEVEPGSTQAELLARIGTGRPAVPDTDATLNELVMACVLDTLDELLRQRAGARHERDVAQEALVEARKRAERADALAEELRTARETIDGLNGDLQEERGKLAFLRDRLGGSTDSAPAAPKPSGPRRTVVDGETGVYTDNQAGDGSLEVSYTDAAGRRRWVKAGTDLDEARSLRNKLVAEAAEQKEQVAA
jgi:hypothetical protein